MKNLDIDIRDNLNELKTNIANTVDLFSQIYLDNSSWEEIGSNGGLPYIFEFNTGYVFTLDDIFISLNYKIHKSVLLERYELKLDEELREKNKNINLKSFYLQTIGQGTNKRNN